MARQLIPLVLIIMFVGCSSQSVDPTPVEVTRVVTQEVTREVVRVETEVVVVTATTEPATPTLPPTAEPTALPEPTAEPEPTAALEPTAAPPLEEGEWVEGEILRTIRVYDIPNEFEGKTVATAEPGIIVHVLHRGGQWYYVKSARSSDATPGWVYRDWIRIDPEDESRLSPFPKALPVLVTKLTQTYRNGDDVWTGTIMNIGSETAYDVQMEITLTGNVGNTETLNDRQAGFVESRALEPGQSSPFVVVTEWVNDNSAYYTHKVLWTVK